MVASIKTLKFISATVYEIKIESSRILATFNGVKGINLVLIVSQNFDIKVERLQLGLLACSSKEEITGLIFC